jgi:hypothetical protein
MRNSASALLSLWSNTDRWVGLLATPTREIKATGYARIRIPARGWAMEVTSDGATLTASAEVAFSGFTSGPIVGFFVSDRADGDVLFPSLFDSGARALVSANDVVFVTPFITLKKAP